MKTVAELAGRCKKKIQTPLTEAAYFSIVEDAWTGVGRKFSAIAAGGPGITMFIGSCDSELSNGP